MLSPLITHSSAAIRTPHRRTPRAPSSQTYGTAHTPTGLGVALFFHAATRTRRSGVLSSDGRAARVDSDGGWARCVCVSEEGASRPSCSGYIFHTAALPGDGAVPTSAAARAARAVLEATIAHAGCSARWAECVAPANCSACQCASGPELLLSTWTGPQHKACFQLTTLPPCIESPLARPHSSRAR